MATDPSQAPAPTSTPVAFTGSSRVRCSWSGLPGLATWVGSGLIGIALPVQKLLGWPEGATASVHGAPECWDFQGTDRRTITWKAVALHPDP